MERGTSVVDSYLIMIYPLTVTQATQIPVEDGVVGCIRDDQVVIDDTLSCNGGQSESGYAPNSFDALKKNSIGVFKEKRKKADKYEERRFSLIQSFQKKGKETTDKVKREVGYIQCSTDAKKWQIENEAKDYYYYSGFGPWWGRKRGGHDYFDLDYD